MVKTAFKFWSCTSICCVKLIVNTYKNLKCHLVCVIHFLLITVYAIEFISGGVVVAYFSIAHTAPVHTRRKSRKSLPQYTHVGNVWNNCPIAEYLGKVGNNWPSTYTSETSEITDPVHTRFKSLKLLPQCTHVGKSEITAKCTHVGNVGHRWPSALTYECWKSLPLSTHVGNVRNHCPSTHT